MPSKVGGEALRLLSGWSPGLGILLGDLDSSEVGVSKSVRCEAEAMSLAPVEEPCAEARLVRRLLLEMGLDTAAPDGLALKLLNPFRLKDLPSDCLLNASYSGLWSKGTTLGDAAAVDRTADDGGLQLLLVCWVGESLMKEVLSVVWKAK